jgi:hypothetical protein
MTTSDQFALLAQIQSDEGGGVFLIVQLLLIIAVIAGLWTTFVKAGKPGWAAIIPIYNIIVLMISAHPMGPLQG